MDPIKTEIKTYCLHFLFSPSRPGPGTGGDWTVGPISSSKMMIKKILYFIKFFINIIDVDIINYVDDNFTDGEVYRRL